MIYTLDLLGILAFAFYGAYLAQRQGFDLFGIGVTALVSSLGGGTIRDLLLNDLPVYFINYLYILAVIGGVVLSILTYKKFTQLQNAILYIDAIGLVTFAFIGAEKASNVGLGLLGILFFATVSAVGGGILRDVMLGRVPEIFYQDFYATPALILGAGYYFLSSYLTTLFAVCVLLILVYLIRILAIYYKIQLWKPQKALL
ncbi:MAG: trimeric intracellular cation channel family protein [Candidatus Pacebacteria bacterium]|nr:trimeric intracellular cation channel family protein [Candidatus Paceibacterota bacterium]